MKRLTDLLEMEGGEVTEWLVDNQRNYVLMQAPKEVFSLEEIAIRNQEILCFDGQRWIVDEVKIDPKTGYAYMLNGTEVQSYMPMPPSDN